MTSTTKKTKKTYLRQELNRIKRTLSSLKLNGIKLEEIRYNTSYKLFIISLDGKISEVQFNPVRLMTPKEYKDYEWIPSGYMKDECYVFTPVYPEKNTYFKSYEAIIEKYGTEWTVERWD